MIFGGRSLTGPPPFFAAYLAPLCTAGALELGSVFAPIVFLLEN